MGGAPKRWFLWLLLCFAGISVQAQDAPKGPLTPPPDHEVKRVSGVEPVDTPPAIPAEEIIKRFSQKEDEYTAARGRYGYHKTIRVEEFGEDGKPSGQFVGELDARRGKDGTLYERFVTATQSTLHFLKLEPEDVVALTRPPAYPVTTSQVAKYDLKYLGKEKVDEVDCYIFQVKPKSVERMHPLFDGVIWVDDKYLDVVKTYGKWVTDLGDQQSPTLPFSIFETYRENVDGKYWIPNYMRSEDTLHLKDKDVPIRVIIKWTDFRPFADAAPAPANAPEAKPHP
ncbi:MAG: hypothetical protein NVS9B13_24900 [Candidatus Acidiferrum sp.]